MSRSVTPVVSILFGLLLIAGCGTPAPTATLVPSTATAVAVAPTSSPVPPTPSSIPPTSSPLPPTAAPPTVASAPTAIPPTSAPAPTPTQPPIAGTVAQLQGLSLDQFFDESYKQLLLRNPEGLTYAGVSEQFGLRNDQLNNLSDAYVRDTQQLEDAILEILHSYDRAALSPEQQVSYDVYEWYLDSRARGHDLIYCEYPLHFMVGSYDVELIRLFTEIHPLVTRQDVEDYISRLSQVADQVAQLMEGLELREQAGNIPPRFIIDMALPNLQAIAGASAASTPFYTVFSQKLSAAKGMSDADKQTFRQAAQIEITRSVIPAFRTLVNHFETLKAAATDDAGLWRLPNGAVCYAYLLRRETSTDLTADEIHAIGLAEVDRIHAELRRAFDAFGYPHDAPLGELLDRAIQEAGSHETQTQAGKDQVVTAYEALIDAMSERLTSVIDLRPRAKIAVVGDPETGGFYVPGSRDGSRPGAFHAYVGGPQVWKFAMATTAYHEAVPGHGFQGTIATELDLPLFRTDLFFNGYCEGWALYSERLAWELGMYDDNPYGNIGRLQFELLRAVRLVVDTGIHAKRWTREEANAYMNEAMGDPSGRFNEVDRYIVLPAQATGYKLGALKILELRQAAIDQLGDRYDPIEFHRVVLGNGMVPLEILERLVQEYIASKSG
jgi:uncharacterized protein (DUF885 family)